MIWWCGDGMHCEQLEGYCQALHRISVSLIITAYIDWLLRLWYLRIGWLETLLMWSRPWQVIKTETTFDLGFPHCHLLTFWSFLSISTQNYPSQIFGQVLIVFFLYYLISCLVQSGFSNFNELRLVRKIFVNFRPTLDCEHFDSPCLGFSPKLKLLRIGVGRIIINTVQPSSSLLLSQTNYMLSEKLLASTRLLISAPIVVNISNLKMFKGAQAHNVQIEMILWDSCLSFNSKWRHSWNELKLICPQLDHSQSIQLSSGVGLKNLKEIPQGQLQSNNQIKFGQFRTRRNSFILISH